MSCQSLSPFTGALSYCKVMCSGPGDTIGSHDQELKAPQPDPAMSWRASDVSVTVAMGQANYSSQKQTNKKKNHIFPSLQGNHS